LKGPVQDIVIDPEYLDVAIPAHSQFQHATRRDHTVFAYIIGGRGYFNNQIDTSTSQDLGSGAAAIDPTSAIGDGTLVLFDSGDEVKVSTEAQSARFLLISGKPIGEPVAWQGPIVMNTQEELRTAFEEYRQGTFVKSR
jgi:redox-sensitive bicupin YhaK (pirin superfamily)